MRNKRLKTFILAIASLCMPLTLQGQTAINIKTVAGFPSGEAGYGLGVSACYAGMIGDRLIVAGGCNFPEVGRKKYYSGIYVAKASADSLSWQLVGYLPEPAAYGGTVAIGDSLILIGGNNSSHSLSTVMSIRFDERTGEVTTRQLQPLPYTVDNMAVTQSDGCIYVFGGNQDGIASSSLLGWNVNDRQGWRYLSRIPDIPRVQPVCALHSGKLYVWGGFFADGGRSRVATVGYKYDIASGIWTQQDAPKDKYGKSITLTGGTAVLADQGVLCAGGVDKDIFHDAISGSYQFVKKEDYLKKPVNWYHFNGNLLYYDVDKEVWTDVPFYDSRLARAGAQLVKWNDCYFYIGGELKPGVRTPEILLISGCQQRQ